MKNTINFLMATSLALALAWPSPSSGRAQDATATPTVSPAPTNDEVQDARELRRKQRQEQREEQQHEEHRQQDASVSDAPPIRTPTPDLPQQAPQPQLPPPIPTQERVFAPANPSDPSDRQERRRQWEQGRDAVAPQTPARPSGDTLRQQQRAEQYRSFSRYNDRLREQYRQRSYGNRNYYNDRYNRYFYAPSIYSYYRSGRAYNVNQYGAQILRYALDEGYREGRLAGAADRMDRWGYNYQNLFVYQDATLGYNGYYVSIDEYSYYFRQGFRRGYDDGYYGRSRYGRYNNSSYFIFESVLPLILDLRPYR